MRECVTHHQCDCLKERMRKLEAVAKAAQQAATEFINDNHKLGLVQQALAALEADG